jgi:hypothetical protein
LAYFSDAGSSGLKAGGSISLIMQGLRIVNFFAYTSLLQCKLLIIRNLLVEAAGVEPDISVENAQLIDSENA